MFYYMQFVEKIPVFIVFSYEIFEIDKGSDRKAAEVVLSISVGLMWGSGMDMSPEKI